MLHQEVSRVALPERNVAFNSSNTAGNLIVVAVYWDNQSATSSIADSAGNAYTSAIGPINEDATGSQL